MSNEIVTITIKDGEAYQVPVGESIFKTLRGLHVFIPSLCGGNGFCGQCRVKVLSGTHSTANEKERKKLTPEELASGWRLACQTPVDSDITIELPETIKDVRMFTAVVTELEMVAHDVRRAKLKLLVPSTLQYLPGAYILLDVPPCPGAPRGASRSYSIASPPSSTSEFEINVKLVPSGIGSGFVHNQLKIGDEVTFTAPYSGYPDCNDENKLICVAGGSGMSPILSILRHLKEIGSTRRVLYFFGVRMHEDLLYIDELQAFEKSLPDFQFIPVVENPIENEVKNFETGLVTEAMELRIRDASDASAYLCGGPGMLTAACDVLTKLGISCDKIFFDRFS